MEKRAGIIFLLILGLFVVFLGINPVGATDLYAERIKDFSVDVTVHGDSSFTVKESIVYDFNQNLKHGIFRNIPLKGMGIKVLEVTDEGNLSYPFEIERGFTYLNIKIGDPDRFITGVHTYNIFYRVTNGLGFFEDHDELYWNITGNEWTVPIEKSSAIVRLPQPVSEANLKFGCFTGIFGSTEKNCRFAFDEGGIHFESLKSFSSGEGLTIVLGWPKGTVNEPGFWQRLLGPSWLLGKFYLWLKKLEALSVLIPVVVFAFLFRRWWHEGKDPKLKKTIIAQYEPPDNLRPAELSLLTRQKIGLRDISATLIDLAARGYLKIIEFKKTGFFSQDNYGLTALKSYEDPKADLRDYERALLRGIFVAKSEGELIQKILHKEEVPRMISELENEFYLKVPGILEKCQEELVSRGYFIARPDKIRNNMFKIGAGVMALSWIFLIFTLWLGVSVFAASLSFFIFAFFMPKRTEKGAKAYWYALGFKEYINTAEKYRMQFQEKENIFEKYLSYAIVFGLVKKWAKAFEGIYQSPPSWYQGDFGPAFTTVVFVDSLDRALTRTGSVFGSRPGGGSGLGGGGFSGGGGGGGGGGSW